MKIPGETSHGEAAGPGEAERSGADEWEPT